MPRPGSNPQRATLAQSPDVALVAVIHALTRRAFYDYGGESSLQLSLTTRYLRGIAKSEGVAAFDALRAQWAAQLFRAMRMTCGAGGDTGPRAFAKRGHESVSRGACRRSLYGSVPQ